MYRWSSGSKSVQRSDQVIPLAPGNRVWPPHLDLHRFATEQRRVLAKNGRRGQDRQSPSTSRLRIRVVSTSMHRRYVDLANPPPGRSVRYPVAEQEQRSGRTVLTNQDEDTGGGKHTIAKGYHYCCAHNPQ